MLHFEPPVVLQLAPGRLLRLEQHAPVRLRVAAGRVWVTQARDPDDHFLDRGDSMLLAPKASVLIGAEHDARIVFELPAAD